MSPSIGPSELGRRTSRLCTWLRFVHIHPRIQLTVVNAHHVWGCLILAAADEQNSACRRRHCELERIYYARVSTSYDYEAYLQCPDARPAPTTRLLAANPRTTTHC